MIFVFISYAPHKDMISGKQHLTLLMERIHISFHVSPLSPLKASIMALPDFPLDLYSSLVSSSDQLTFKMSEP